MKTVHSDNYYYLILNGNESAPIKSLCEQWAARYNAQPVTHYEDERGRCEDTGEWYEISGDEIEGTAYRAEYDDKASDETHMIARYESAFYWTNGNERMSRIYTKIMQEEAGKLIQAGYTV